MGHVVLIALWLFLALSHAKQLYKTDCSKLPKSIAPQYCCRFPEIFEDPLLDMCYNSHGYVPQCFVECLFTDAGICRQGKCSYTKALDYLDREPSLQRSPFKDIYIRAFKKCIAKANDMRSHMLQRFRRRGCDPLPEIIHICVRNEMFTSCPSGYWNDKVDGCSKKRDFIRNCIKNY